MTEKSTVRTREMGIELKTQREAKQMSLRELARRADWSASKVSGWENGRRISPIDAAIYLANCGTKAPERNRLLELTKPPSDLYWVRPYFSALVDPAKSLIVQENLATRVISNSPTALPGMLQTEDYVRTLYEMSGRYTTDRLQLLIQARMDRQRLLQRTNPPDCLYFVYEHTLRSIVRDPALMHEQLQSLVLATNLPHCTIRVVPASAPPYHLVGSRFTIMEFAEHPAVAYEETFAAGLFVDDRVAVEAFYVLRTRLEQVALSERDSRDFLIRLTEEFELMTD
ncbi:MULTISPECIES: helix-turn-helix domain-containing protein [unclassified Amycolatopsis]|uniref:helix-turn-helix domain-containing protein n=1 Tax=unclassified Amycolatopsis TaxID=2618356 RepID=UPI002E14B758|nr:MULTISPECIES: helix-turn-helix transcriptional regulator [unclassified Amycolatopsis]WSJ77593.1 helix-turn-helix domain-containing protein [Amycolatopsis sp. NBC_01307]WSK78835.1 helix-turn-helix domain-containing protein [Amycolatopsis sp. NBC_01286]